MKRTIYPLFTVFLFIAITQQIHAQEQIGPEKTWEKTFGGSNDDQAKDVLINPNGTYMIAGYSASNDGVITGHHGTAGTYDGLVVKTDAVGNIIWLKSIGGSNNDYFNTIIPIGNNQYACIGYTFSNDGDVAGNHGNSDAWVVIIDQNGTIISSRCYGGTLYDDAAQGIVAPGGGLAFTGTSWSSDGDVLSGEIGRDDPDTWVFKINASTGNIIWEKCIDYNNLSKEDRGYNIMKSESDSLYVYATGTGTYQAPVGYDHTSYPGCLYTLDNITGNRSPAQWVSSGDSSLSACAGPTGYHFMANDYWWIYPMDCYESEASYYYRSFGNSSFTTNKYTYSSCYGGGTNYDNLFFAPVHGIAADDSSYVGVGYGSNLYSGGRYAMLKCRGNLNNFIWPLTVKDYGSGIFNSVKVFPGQNDYLVVGNFYGTSSDGNCWITRIKGLNKIMGHVFLDQNNNNTYDVGEPAFGHGIVKSIKPNLTVGGLPANGLYVNFVDTGSFVTTCNPSLPYYTVTPASATSVFTEFNDTSFVDFAVHMQPNVKDYAVTATPLSGPRPGFEAYYKIDYQNRGTITQPATTIKFIKDHHLSYVNAIPAPTNISGDILTWDIANLPLFGTGTILMQLLLDPPPLVNINDTLRSSVMIDSTGDYYTVDNLQDLTQVVRGSYDPNDKSDNFAGVMTTTDLAAGKYLFYTVRFQNTGNDTAFNIIIRDTLDSKLMWDSIEVVSVSHPYVAANIRNGNDLQVSFDNIKLVDSIHNEPLSHGYITFRIKPQPTLVAGDTIKNKASIYFDFNPPVETNTQLTFIKTPAVLVPMNILSFAASPVNSQSLLQWEATENRNTIEYIVETSTDSVNFTGIYTQSAYRDGAASNQYSYTHTTPVVGNNYYRIKMNSIDGTFIYSSIKKVVFDETNNNTNSSISIAPNPAHNYININVSLTAANRVFVHVTDMAGRKVYKKEQDLPAGANTVSIPCASWQTGLYNVEVNTGEEKKTMRFMKTK